MQSTTSRPVGRIELLDIARGVALVAMTLFHFGWDLEMFGFAGKGFASQPAMIWFARSIAISFLMLVGISLVLAHQKAFRPLAFVKRLAVIGAAALAITVATYFATPSAFIFFGILHHIAVASVLGLVFLYLPWWLNLVASGMIFGGIWLQSPALNSPLWWWTGLSETKPVSNDYVPVVPFFAAVLAGIALAQFALERGIARKMSALHFHGKMAGLLKFIGNHSLVYYLLHQPVMIALLYGVHVLIR